MNRIKKIIIILIIVIIFMIIVLLRFSLNSNLNKENNVQLGVEGEIEDFTQTDIEQVSNKVEFFTVVQCVSQYLQQININNSIYYGYDENNNYTKVTEENIIKENIYKLLSKEYIEKNNITISNIYDYIDELEENVLFVPLKMNVLSKEDVDKYVVYGIIEDFSNKYIKDIYLIVNLDRNNKTYSIEPISKKYNNISEVEITNYNTRIEKNDSNTYVDAIINDNFICKTYIDYYKKLALGEPEILYNYLDEEYRKIRFETLENFKTYVEENKNEILSLQGENYLVEIKDDYTEYVIKDKYQNLYIFDEDVPMNFTLKLDTYTIMTDKFKETYNNSSDERKVQMNIDKFFQMINRKDYRSSYNCLDKNFRKTYIKTENDFKNVAKNKFFLYNSIEYNSFKQVGDNTYAYEIALTDLTGESLQIKNVTIIMRLEGETDFVMSFNIE